MYIYIFSVWLISHFDPEKDIQPCQTGRRKAEINEVRLFLEYMCVGARLLIVLYVAPLFLAAKIIMNWQ